MGETLVMLGLISLPALAYALVRRARHGEFLPYEPRWPAPWGAVGAVLAASFVLLSIMSVFSEPPAADRTPEFTSAEFVQSAFGSLAMSLVMIGFMALLLRRATGATLTDLGVPPNFRTLASDFRLGAITTLAALLPVYGLNALLMLGLNLPSGHPTLTRLLNNPDPMVLLAAVLTAGVAAPLFEEFVFRLLLQGWLEKVEDEALALRGKLNNDPAGKDSPPSAEELAIDPENPYDSPGVQQVLRLRRRAGVRPTPPSVSFGGLPHGWAPVLISSFIFAAVHIGQGAAPIPLFVFALALGYLYQRTHRLSPSIAAHMVFNLLSLVATRLGS